jgi:hypothetical protein
VRSLLFLLFALATATAACGRSNSDPSLLAIGTPPAGSFDLAEATIPVGIVMGFAAKASDTDVVTAGVDDPTIATVAPATQAQEFAIIGTAPGTTTLRVYAGGSQIAQIPVTVTPPAP